MTLCAQAETLLMSELEARIIASTSAEAAPEEAAVPKASPGASPKARRCGCAAHCKLHCARRLTVASARKLRTLLLLQASCCRVLVRVS